MGATGGVDGEGSKDSALAMDHEFEVGGYDEDLLAGSAAVDSDLVAAPADLSAGVDGVKARSGWRGSGAVRCCAWCCLPSFDWCSTVGGSVRAPKVVVVSPGVELGLEFG